MRDKSELHGIGKWAMTTIAAIIMLLSAILADARPTDYIRPFGVMAPWNRPVAGLPRHPQSATYASRLWAGSGNGNINQSMTSYTYPVYYAENATGNYTVNGGNATINGKQMPWNPAWSAAGGSDAQVIVLDPATGREWDLWQVRVSGSTLNISNGSLIGKSESSSSPGGIGDYRTKENCWAPSRGIGCQYLAMLVRPEEIAQGHIDHALSMPITNPSHAIYVAPATKLEHSGGDSGNTVPEGMRFALDITDAQITSWVATKPAAYQKMARAVAVALRDYGWFITDTSGSDHLQFEAAASAGALWKAQGIDPASSTTSNLLDGLITQSRIYTIVPSNQYGTTPSPTPTPTPTHSLAYGKPTTTSSVESSAYAGKYAVDELPTTRWASVVGVDPQSLTVDLQGDYDISKVTLVWEAAYAKSYSVQVSLDGVVWTTIGSLTNGDGGTDEIVATSHNASRYVRMNGMIRGTQWGYSLYEISIYGDPIVVTPPPDCSVEEAKVSAAQAALAACRQ